MPDVKIDASAMDNVPELDYQEDETVHDSIEEEKPSEEGNNISCFRARIIE